ncbi:MAG TPA: DUF92 domain-containing protein [Sphingobacteriaceae bacterium]
MTYAEMQHLPAIFLIVTGAGVSVVTHKLTFFGALAGVVIAFSIYFFAGYTGLIMLASFFITGTFATSWRKKDKQNRLNKSGYQSKRSMNQVLANAAVPSLIACIIYIDPANANLYQLVIAGSLASATADTLSSELGMIYGRRFYNVLSLKTEAKGLDGVISLEGTLIGCAGATLIAFIYSFGYGFNHGFWMVIFAGTAGNLTDSILGAALERKNLMTNDMVNFLSTVSAAVTTWFLSYLTI